MLAGGSSDSLLTRRVVTLLLTLLLAGTGPSVQRPASASELDVPLLSLEEMAVALEGTERLPAVATPEPVSLAADDWQELLLVVAVGGYGYTDAQMVSFLLAIAEDGVVRSPLASRGAALKRFKDLVGLVRYYTGICYTQMESLGLEDRADFYKAMAIAIDSSPANLNAYGLATPFEETKAFVAAMSSRTLHWQERLGAQGLLDDARVVGYRSAYKTHARDADAEMPADETPVVLYAPARTREELVDLVVSVARCFYGIDHPVATAFMLSLVEAESNFDPEAKSWADARGLVQLLESTAQSILPWVTEEQEYLYNPFINLHLSVAYVRYVADIALRNRQSLNIRTARDLLRAVMIGYNSGPGNLRKHKLKTPFKETQNYIRRIEKRMPVWHRRLSVGGLTKSGAHYLSVYRGNCPEFVHLPGSVSER